MESTYAVHCCNATEPSDWGYTGPSCSKGTYVREPEPPGWGTLESEIVKCGHKSRGTRTRQWLRWRGPAAIVNGRPYLSSERASHICSWAADECLTPRQTGRLTAGRNMTLTLSSTGKLRHTLTRRVRTHARVRIWTLCPLSSEQWARCLIPIAATSGGTEWSGQHDLLTSHLLHFTCRAKWHQSCDNTNIELIQNKITNASNEIETQFPQYFLNSKNICTPCWR
jgi:hypothetical protein